MKYRTQAFGLILIAAVFPLLSASAQMSSSNYKIQSDSINFGGGNSVSSNYALEDTGGEIATGDSSSENYQMRAGYQEMQSTYLALALNNNAALGSLSGLIGGVATGSSTATVITDSPSGYYLTVESDVSPALHGPGGAIFPDYMPAASTTPDYQFSVAATSSAFGFTVDGADITPSFLDNGSTCNTGSTDSPDHCWEGFSTTPKTVANRPTRTPLSGSDTVIKYQAEIGNGTIQDAGSYSATITVTAVSL